NSHHAGTRYPTFVNWEQGANDRYLEPENIQSPYVGETAGLTKRFGERTVVRGVDLRVPRGSAFGYLGPNGAGKTTLIRMLLGLTPATAGSLQVRRGPRPAAAGDGRLDEAARAPRPGAAETGALPRRSDRRGAALPRPPHRSREPHRRGRGARPRGGEPHR